MSGLQNFSTWLKTAWTDFLTWFDVEEQQLASFLYPILQDAKTLVKQDLLGDIISGVPIVAAAIGAATGNLSEVLAIGVKAAEDFIVPLLEKQGVTVASTTLSTLANGLVAQAQAAQEAVTAGKASTTGTTDAVKE